MSHHSDAGVSPEGLDTVPWYRQFWPWFLIALPATVVVAGITTLVIAIRNDSSLVVDDYYKQGLGINRVLEEDRTAVELGLGAELNLDLETGEVYVLMRGDPQVLTDTLTLLWIHPTDSERDQTLQLNRVGDDRYRAQLAQRPQGRWYIQLKGAQPRDWLLRSELMIKEGDWVQLQFGAL